MEPPPQPGLLALGNWKMLPGLLEMHLAWQGWRWGKAPPLTENKLCFPVCEEKKKRNYSWICPGRTPKPDFGRGLRLKQAVSSFCNQGETQEQAQRHCRELRYIVLSSGLSH